MASSAGKNSGQTLDCYDLPKDKPGLCLVFKQTKFLNVQTTDEYIEATNNDAGIIETRFRNLGFEVQIKRDKNFSEIRRIMRTDFGSYRSLVVFFLTLGKDGKLLTQDEGYYLENLMKFTLEETVNKTSLSSKPKIFIAQAPGFKLDDDRIVPPKHAAPVPKVNMPVFADVFIAFPARPGCFVFTEHHQTFVNVLCDIIHQHGSQADWEILVDKARIQIENCIGEVDEDAPSSPKPISVSSLTKEMFLMQQNETRMVLEDYPKKKKAGKILIINNFNFDNPALNLPGTVTDVNAIRSTFLGKGFELDYHKNLTKQELRQKLEAVATEDFSDYSCFVLYILSHGNINYNVMARDTNFDFQELLNETILHSTSTLAETQIVCFVEACSGNKKDVGTTSAIVLPVLPEESIDNPLFFPKVSDLLLVFASSPGNCAYCSCSGSTFTQRLCATIDAQVNWDLMKILTLTKQNVAQANLTVLDGNRSVTIPVKQVPVTISTLKNRILF